MYSINDSDFKKYWEDAMFILDTSVLLYLKQCDKRLAIDIIDIFSFKKSDIWIPHQVYNEFNNAIHKVKSGACGRVDKFKKELEKSIEKIKISFDNIAQEAHEDGFTTLYEVMKQVNVDGIFLDMLTKFNSEAEDLNEENRDFLQSGIVETFYHIIFKNIGSGFSEREILKIEEEGEDRYKNNIPPGNKDNSKNNGNKYGDLIIWKEILKKVSSVDRPLMFITRDVKSDWFYNGYPRSELYQEVNSCCGNYKRFHILQLSDFLKMSQLCVNKDVSILLQELIKNQRLSEAIEKKLSTDFFAQIQEQLSEELRNIEDIDYINLDSIQDISEAVINKMDDHEDELFVNCSVDFYCSFDYVIHWGGEDHEIYGDANVQCNIDFEVEVEAGDHNEENKMLVLNVENINFDNIEVTKASDPRGFDEEFEDEFEIDCFEDEDYYEDDCDY